MALRDGLLDVVSAVPDFPLTVWRFTCVPYKWVVRLEDGSDLYDGLSRGEGLIYDRIVHLRAVLLNEPRAFDSLTPAIYDIAWWLRGSHVDVRIFGALQTVSKSWRRVFDIASVPESLRWRNRAHGWRVKVEMACMYEDDHETLSKPFTDYLNMGVGCVLPGFHFMD